MPYPITNFVTGPGFASYKLSQSESFTVLAATLMFNNGPTPSYDFGYADFLDQTGTGLIFRQFLGKCSDYPVSVSLGIGAEPWFISHFEDQGYPQDQRDFPDSAVTYRLAPQTLMQGCSVVFYLTSTPLQGDQRFPLFVDTNAVVTGPHLWVDDVPVGRRDLGPPLPPLLTHQPEGALV